MAEEPPPSSERVLLIDTDPGVDDAMAVLLAFSSPGVRVVGLTTVYGNVPTTRATQNALRLVEMAGASEVGAGWRRSCWRLCVLGRC